MKNIYILDEDDTLIISLKEIMKKEKNIKIKNYKMNELKDALTNIPDLVVINEDNLTVDIKEVFKEIKENEDNSITPIVVISSKKDQEHIIEILKNDVEVYLNAPVNNEILYYTIMNIMKLLNRNRMVSPLTGLPGNVQIQAEMKKRLLNKEDFAILYIDLDNFKAYNDVYGFLNGDEIIKFTARCMLNHLHDTDTVDNFIGHIGGDDFVAITSNLDCEEICQNIVLEFDQGKLKYFNQEDIEKGYLEVPNRKCIIEQFPLTTISIGVVIADKGRFHNVLEIGEVAAQVKHLAKATPGSTYIIDRRKNDETIHCPLPREKRKE